MAKKMLIDATHSEEQRVAIMDGNRLDDFEAETSTKKQFKGNIYLAKVIRIEPSLQAAFVEFGNNRHGFLPFSEIHLDYYRIPVSDRPHPEVRAQGPEPSRQDGDAPKKTEALETVFPEIKEVAPDAELVVDDSLDLQDDEEAFIRRPKVYHYKIQEVIKRRQIMLIQVVKEERGNKGAALTTYLSLPGRYCVLMPNAGHRSGGISRKITDLTDRKRLREVLNDLPIPDGTSLIVRTAGQDRNKLEIRRDFEYLLRLWSEIRETTLKSIAPKLIYAEGDVIKRTIRDNYGKEMDEILVEGEEGYKEAKAFMKTLIPSHAKKVKLYKDHVPLFRRYNVEAQIDAIMNPVAALPSGGSIVINPTEALVAIDVNSGKSTRERHIDETAVKTNLEAADEIARQMRLRDLSGLVVIDFIDMNDTKYIQAVEKRLKDATRGDRARIQIGRISQFGLLELSRQRLRPSIIEANMKPCPHCKGAGVVRSIESMALHVLRAIESEGIAGHSAEIIVTVPAGVDLYLLNQKRSMLIAMEQRYQFSVQIQRDESMVAPDFRIDRLKQRLHKPEIVESVIQLQSSMDRPLSSQQSHPSEIDTQQALEPMEIEDENEDNDTVQTPPPHSKDRKRQRHGLFNNRRRGQHKKTPRDETKESIESPTIEHREVSSSEEGMTKQSSESVDTLTQQDHPEKRDHNRRRRHRRGHNRRTTKAATGENESREGPRPTAESVKSDVAAAFTPSASPRTEPAHGDTAPEKKKKRGWWKRLLES
ncbi:Rne/Rng family ribonuclease [Candidatus Paracaedibacter symbiosus]|uniref:Rne/Rng family ribonuclease n=1 Tax=Candidatus Paracaedibacter symbiosus TaxID=244582 RepID=UPI00068D2877|nr:ribonuclease E/G [Candidatus Paracaedibacter symbiosus]